MSSGQREKLTDFAGKEKIYVGRIGEFKTRKEDHVIIPTIVLNNVRLRDGEEVLTDHIWIDDVGETKRVQKVVEVKEGDYVVFQAIAKVYSKKTDKNLMNDLGLTAMTNVAFYKGYMVDHDNQEKTVIDLYEHTKSTSRVHFITNYNKKFICEVVKRHKLKSAAE